MRQWDYNFCQIHVRGGIMAGRVIADEAGKIAEVYEKVIGKHFHGLKCLHFIYAFREDEKFDPQDGQFIMAETIKFNTKHRDLFGKDVLMEVHQETWENMLPLERERLAFHECLHVHVENEEGVTNMGELFTPKEDKQGRIMFKIQPHDVIIRRFKRELMYYGLAGDEKEVLNVLQEVAATEEAKQLGVDLAKKK